MARHFSLFGIAVLPGLLPVEGVTQQAAAQGFDHAGDPLPAGATMRLGTTRLRQRQMANGVAFSPNGKHLVSMGWGDSIRFWDVETGRQVRRLKCREAIFAVAFSPNGSLLASVGESRIRLWDLTPGVQLYESDTQSGRIYSVAFAPDGETFATAGDDKSVHVWDTKSGKVLRRLPTDGGRDAHPVAYSADGRLLASGSQGGTIRIWDLSVDAAPMLIEKAHGREVISLAFTADGAGLISAGYRFERREDRFRTFSEVYLWNVADRSKVHEFRMPVEPMVGDAGLALSPDGSTLVTSHYEWIITWDMESHEPMRLIPLARRSYSGERSHGLAISPDNRLVASIGDQHKVNVWNIETGDPVFPQPDTHHGGVLSIATSPDGNLLATGGEEGDVHLWDALSGQHIRRIIQHNNWIRSVQFLPDGERVLAAGEFHGPDTPGFVGVMKLVRISNGEVEKEWPLPDRAMCTTVSRDGTRFAVALGLGMRAFQDAGPPEIRVYNLEGDSELPILKGHEGEIQQMHFDEDGTTLWSTSKDGTIRKWNVESGEEIEKLSVGSVEGVRSRVQIAAVSADLQRVAYGLYVSGRPADPSRGQLGLIGLEKEERSWQQTLPAHFPNTSAFSPDNQVLAVSLRATLAGGATDQIAILHTGSGRDVLSFELEDGVVRSLAFSRDGRTLYSGMDRGDILVWDVSRAYE